MKSAGKTKQNVALRMMMAFAKAMPFRIFDGMSNVKAAYKGAQSKRRRKNEPVRSKSGSLFRGYYHKYTNVMSAGTGTPALGTRKERIEAAKSVKRINKHNTQVMQKVRFAQTYRIKSSFPV